MPPTTGDTITASKETINSEYVLHLHGSGTSGNSCYYPLELAVPSHTAGTDNLRIKVRLSKSNYSGNVGYTYYHRKDDESAGIRAIGSNFPSNTVSTNSSSPSTHTVNLTLSANGTREINSLYLNLSMQNSSTSSIVRVHSAEVETY